MRTRLPLLLAILALPGALAAQAPTPARVAQLADSLARDYLARRGAPSVAIAVTRGGETLVARGWGEADVENGVAATERSVYRIGSVTKQFTAAAVMQLVERGQVRLDDTIGAHLATLPAAWRGVTVRQLLNHTSGIPSYTEIGAPWVRRWAEEMSPDTLVALTASLPMWFAPGSQWRYDNTGYVVLGMLVETVAGRSWGADVVERFAKPLGLSDTRECLTRPLVPRRVAGYQPAGEGWVNAPFLAMSQPYAAGALCSTVLDMARWNRALNAGGVVSAASYRQMTTPEGAAASSRYGFGLGRDTVAGREVIAHSGGIHGFSSANAWIAEGEIAITVLTNSQAGRASELLRQLARAAVGAPLEARPTLQPITREEQARYLGVYALALPGGARDFTIAEGAVGLTAQLAGQSAAPLLHYGDHTFGVTVDPTARLIFTVEGDRATSVTVLQGGARMQGPRR